MGRINNTKEVFYNEYCEMCEHWTKSEAEYPCNVCLECHTRGDSHIPLHYTKKEVKARVFA